MLPADCRRLAHAFGKPHLFGLSTASPCLANISLSSR